MSIEDQDRAAVYEALDGAFTRFEATYGTIADDSHLTDQIMTDLAPVIANIRRHAAADALKAQASHLHRVSAEQFEAAGRSNPGSVTAIQRYAGADQLRFTARTLTRAAQTTIESGWEHACAVEFPATREDPAYGCENPVENEGDLCASHDEGDEL